MVLLGRNELNVQYFLFQIYGIFKNCGIQMTLDDFDRIYKMASQRHPSGLVTVESFRNVLDECQALELQRKEIV